MLRLTPVPINIAFVMGRTNQFFKYMKGDMERADRRLIIVHFRATKRDKKISWILSEGIQVHQLKLR